MGNYMPGQEKAVERTKSKSPALLKLVTPADLFHRAEKLYDSIARRAYELFESNGRIFGRDLEDWFRAESELLHPVHVNVAETDEGLTVRAEVPGFTAKELEIGIEPRRVTISGKRETKEERKEKKFLYEERCSNQILRVIDLPVAVDADKAAAATLKDGVLELRMPKAAPAKRQRRSGGDCPYPRHLPGTGGSRGALYIRAFCRGRLSRFARDATHAGRH
jgi:HSP20 family protein